MSHDAPVAWLSWYCVFETRILISDDARCRLGRIPLAGTIASSAGVVRPRRYPSYAIVYVVGGGGRYADELGTDRPVQAAT